MRLVACKVDVFVREIDAFVAPVCTVVRSSLVGVSSSIADLLGSGVLDWSVLLRNKLLRNALHVVLNWSIRLLWVLSVSIHVGRFLNRMLWVGVATGINSMLDRGALKWKLSVRARVDVHIGKILSSAMNGNGVLLWLLGVEVGIYRPLSLQASVIMHGAHTLLLESGINDRTSLNVLSLPLNRARLLLLDGGIKSNTSMSTILNATLLSLDIVLGNWRLRNLLQLCIESSTSASQTLDRPLVSVISTRAFLQLDVSLYVFEIDICKVATGEIQLVFPPKKSFG